MQTDQLIWCVAGGIAVLILLFLVRLFRIPRDDPYTATEQGPTQSADAPHIRSRKDAIAFLRQETGNQELALLLTDVAERIGRDGCIDVRQGGSGNPYAIEYDERAEEERAADRRSPWEIKAEIDRLKEALKRATSDDECDLLERKIALLAGAVCTFWINVTPSADYERQKRLIKESFGKLKSAAAGQR
jgi:hypothetical protein